MRGAIINLSAWLILPFMDAIAKYLSYSLPVLQVTWFRFFFSTLITLLFIFIFSRNSLVFSKNLKSQVIRGLLLLTSSVLFFYSKRNKNLAKKITISPTYVPFLKEQEFNPDISTDNWDLHKVRLDKFRRSQYKGLTFFVSSENRIYYLSEKGAKVYC